MVGLLSAFILIFDAFKVWQSWIAFAHGLAMAYGFVNPLSALYLVPGVRAVVAQGDIA